jgi:hypothetical protein
LVGTLPTIGGHVLWGLDGFAGDGDVINVHEVVAIRTPTDTDFLGLLHLRYCKFNLYPEI